jgi:hypothetical protein
MADERNEGFTSIVGTLTIDGNYKQVYGANGFFDIASASSYDKLNVTGRATLDGAAVPSLLNCYTPSAGTSFLFVPYSSVVGAFRSTWLAAGYTDAEGGTNCPGTGFTPIYSASSGLTAVVIGSLAPLSSTTGVTPATGTTAGGNTVTISGTNFVNVLFVSIGAFPAVSFNVVSTTSLTAIVPPEAAGTATVLVVTATPGIHTEPPVYYTVTAGPAPTISGESPSSGSSGGGTQVVITGSGFTGATGVSFGGTAAPCFKLNSDTQITACAPAHAPGVVDVSVTTYGGTSATVSAD